MTVRKKKNKYGISWYVNILRINTWRGFCTEVEIMEKINIIAAIVEELNHPSNRLFVSYELGMWLQLLAGLWRISS